MLLIILASLVIGFVGYCGMRYAFGIVLKAIAGITFLAVTVLVAGRESLVMAMICLPVLMILVGDMTETTRTIITRFMTWLAQAKTDSIPVSAEPDVAPIAESPIRGEWIDGNIQRLERQQPILGDLDRRQLTHWL